MKTKILCALFALCMIVSLLPLTALAADPEITVKFSNTETADRFSLTVAPGETKYVTSTADKKFAAWTEAEAPADNFVKLEYPADGNSTLQVTLQNIDADCTSAAYKSPCIEFTAGEYAVAMETVGTNTLTHGNSACIFYEATKGMTITGEGTLNLNNSMSVDGSIWARGGDLLLKNTQINFKVTINNTSVHSAILSAKGNVNIEGCKITSETAGGALVFMGTMTEKVGRYTLDDATDRFVTIKDCEITHKTRVRGFSTNTPVSISNSTMTMTITGSTSSSALFTTAPSFEGEYTAIAGLAKNADKPEKLKLFDAKKLGSYTYFYMVPGIVELLPEPTTEPTTAPTEPTTAPTEPEVTVPEVTVPEVTTPEATTPEVTTPEVTTPEVTTPDTTDPKNTDPKETEGTTPGVPTIGTIDTSSNNPLKVVLIIAIILVVAAGAAVGAILYLRKKKA